MERPDIEALESFWGFATRDDRCAAKVIQELLAYIRELEAERELIMAAMNSVVADNLRK